jgi:NAD dependent epimerase/dehydratase family enzyme
MPDNGNSRVDRIEQSLEKLTDVVGKRADVVVQLAGVMTSLAEGQQRIQTAQLETTEKLDALIHIVDESIRNRPQPGA